MTASKLVLLRFGLVIGVLIDGQVIDEAVDERRTIHILAALLRARAPSFPLHLRRLAVCGENLIEQVFVELDLLWPWLLLALGREHHALAARVVQDLPSRAQVLLLV